MLLNLASEIDKLKDEDLRPILKQIISAINVLHEKRGYFTNDVMVDTDKHGVVIRGESGHYFRLSLTGTDTVTTTWTDLGPKKPERED